MNNSYLKVIERLQKYRTMLGKTQESMGKEFGVNQSHYSKLEQGNKIISYESLQQFRGNGGDVDYLLTGQHKKDGYIDSQIARCKTRSGKIELLRCIMWAMDQGEYMSRIHPGSFSGLKRKNIAIIGRTDTTENIWEKICEIEHITQVQMAMKLDINIKRYRRIEKGKVMPDAEILNTLYEEYGYIPGVILDEYFIPLDELNRIWEKFPEYIQKRLSSIIDEATELINGYEEKI